MLVVVALLGALIYALVWTIERRRTVGRSRPPRSKPRIVAPDDDDDFLRSLRDKEPERDEDDPEDPRTAP